MCFAKFLEIIRKDNAFNVNGEGKWTFLYTIRKAKHVYQIFHLATHFRDKILQHFSEDHRKLLFASRKALEAF